LKPSFWGGQDGKIEKTRECTILLHVLGLLGTNVALDTIVRFLSPPETAGHYLKLGQGYPFQILLQSLFSSYSVISG
jgi:hypothetical protein